MSLIKTFKDKLNNIIYPTTHAKAVYVDKLDGTNTNLQNYLDNSVHSIPSGGIKDNVLKKKSGTDYDVEWGTVEGESPLKYALKFSSDGAFYVVVSSPQWDGIIEYSTDNGNTWTTWTGSRLNGNASQPIYFRGTNNTIVAGRGGTDNWEFTGKYCTGNIETLLDYQTVKNGGHPVMGENCYKFMFYYCRNLVIPPELPATTLANWCYANMFEGCISLTTAPALPATTLADFCYYMMFCDCGALTVAPELPATTLANQCYASMFSSTSIILPPELPATTLVLGCYYCMFSHCASLIKIPELPATTLAESCYQWMFGDCTSLTVLPKLPAKTLVDNCYYRMFRGCSNIKISTTQTGIYQYPFRIPFSGTGTAGAQYSLYEMFTSTGGTFTGEPTVNTTYYADHPVGDNIEKNYGLPINPTSDMINNYENGAMWIVTQ